MFREQAKTKAEIRRAADAEGHLDNDKFTTEISGLEETKSKACKSQNGKSEAASAKKIAFDRSFVKRTFDYFAEEKDTDNLTINPDNPKQRLRNYFSVTNKLIELAN